MKTTNQDSKQKKIFFLVPSFRGGGAERIVLNLVNNLDKTKFEVGLITISGEGEYKNLLSKEVEHFNLGKKKARQAIFSLIKLLKKEKPDVVMGAVIQSTIILYLTSFFIPKGIKIMNRLENFYSKTVKGQKFVQKMLFQRALEKSNHIITISNEMEESLRKNIKISKGQIKTIYNPIDLEHIKKAAQEEVSNDLPESGPIVVSCGRLTEQKGFEYLIKAFQKVKNNYSDAQLLILGQGELKDSLQELARSLDIKDSVHFLGFKENPFKYIARADIFVLSSLWEGFGNVLVEAMACGTPIVSTDCPSGPKEILENGENGKLVKTEDVGSLADGIVDLLKDKDLQEKYKESGRRRAQDFSVDKIIKEYEDFLCKQIINLQ